MVVILLFVLACLLGWVLWRRLRRTRLAFPLRLLLTLFCVVVSYVALFWIGVYVSIYLFQLNDPVS